MPINLAILDDTTLTVPESLLAPRIGETRTIVQTVDNVIPARPAGGSALFVMWVAWDDPAANTVAGSVCDRWIQVPAP